MIGRNIYTFLLFLMLPPSLAGAKVLSSDWGMSSSSLMKIETVKLKNKKIECKKSCSVVADYTIFDEKMKASFWFNADELDSDNLKEIWLESRVFSEDQSASLKIIQKKLFNDFKKLYTTKFGEPSIKFRDRTMEMLNIATYVWKDASRNNLFHLENWLNKVRLKYKPIR